ARDRAGARRGAGRAPARRAVARACAAHRRRRLRGARVDSRPRSRRPPRRAACAAHRRLRRPHVRDRKRRAAADARPRRRRRDTATHGGVPRVTVAILNIDWQTLADAVGIGLVFGVLRLVNFAYGQLVMAGAYALAYGSSWGLPVGVSILFCFGVV